MSHYQQGPRGSERDAQLKKLSRINGSINKMNVQQMQNELKRFKLDSGGSRDILSKRLKNHYRKQILGAEEGVVKSTHSCLCVVDFEATCMERNEEDFTHEIIEFPAVILSVSQRRILTEFHSFCRPVLNPVLSDFCVELTGISQEQVESAPTFAEVLPQFLTWLGDHEVKHGCKVALLSHGAWDFGKFLFVQCVLDKVDYPPQAKSWINIKKTFGNYFRSNKVSVEQMLSQFGLQFEGRLHCGLDDTKNIARVVVAMLEDGAKFRLNEQIKITRSPSGVMKATTHPISRDQYSSRVRARRGGAARRRAEVEELYDSSENEYDERDERPTGGNGASNYLPPDWVDKIEMVRPPSPCNCLVELGGYSCPECRHEQREVRKYNQQRGGASRARGKTRTAAGGKELCRGAPLDVTSGMQRLSLSAKPLG